MSRHMTEISRYHQDVKEEPKYLKEKFKVLQCQMD